MNDIVTTVDPAKKQLTTVIYVLYAAAFVTGGLTSIAAIIMNYIKQDEVRGSYLESHFRWQIRTFWFSLLWAVIGFILMFVIIGFFILLANVIWVIYRLAKGWMNLNEDKPMYVA